MVPKVSFGIPSNGADCEEVTKGKHNPSGVMSLPRAPTRLHWLPTPITTQRRVMVRVPEDRKNHLVTGIEGLSANGLPSGFANSFLNLVTRFSNVFGPTVTKKAPAITAEACSFNG